MHGKKMVTIGFVSASLAVVAATALSAGDKYSVKVPGGLAFSEARGYEGWQLVSASMDGDLLARSSPIP